MAAQLSQRERELMASNDRLTVMASIDMLSGLANRRGFQSRLDFEWMRAQQYDSELSLLMIDVDNFKLYNDTYGHVSGDSVLKQVASTIERCLGQSGDLAARFGGEEFAVVMPATSPGAARLLGEKIRLAIESLRLEHAHSSTGRYVTISIGGASIVPAPGVPTTSLIEAADRALYRAKHDGKNRVEIDAPPARPPGGGFA